MRWPNLGIIVLVQYLIRFGLIEFLNIPHALNHFYFFLGVLCSVTLAAAGYIINDIYDQENDAINKPQRVRVNKGLSEQSAWYWFLGLNVVACISGYFLALEVGLSSLGFIPVIAAALLYLYATDFKKRPLIGNLIVSILTALPVFFVGVFDLLPAASSDNAQLMGQVFKVISAYSLFAFYLNFMRELVKDAEDYVGDAKMGFKTLAVLLKPNGISYLVFSLGIVLLGFSGFYNYYIWHDDVFSAAYLLLFVNAPLLYFLFKILKAKTPRAFKGLSTLLKLIMLFGILSILVFSISLKVNFS
jgi:4-hydroxybenzoate polyprenyltransferase